MQTTQDIKESRLADAWAELQAHANSGEALTANAYRLAFADPEFMLRRETRGLRFQLEMLKPDVELQSRGIDNTIVVFGSARFPSRDEAQAGLQAARQSQDSAAIATAEQKCRNAEYYENARLFSRLVAGYGVRKPNHEKLFICTGGGPGIMEAANRGAFDVGALSIGLNIALPHEQSANPYVTPELSFKFHYFACRKMHFMMRAKALVAYPGGFGTLDELFEVVTLVQTRKVKPVPIILMGREYWKRLINFEVLVEEGAISKEDLSLFQTFDDPLEAWNAIKIFYNLS